MRCVQRALSGQPELSGWHNLDIENGSAPQRHSPDDASPLLISIIQNIKRQQGEGKTLTVL